MLSPSSRFILFYLKIDFSNPVCIRGIIKGTVNNSLRIKINNLEYSKLQIIQGGN